MKYQARRFGTPREQMEWNLGYRRPAPVQVDAIEVLRPALIAAGNAILDLCPEGRERAVALTALEEATMWAVASIARATPAVSAD